MAHVAEASTVNNIVQQAAHGVTGRREWPAFVDWFSRNLQPSLEGWIGPVEVIYEGAKPLPVDGRYVFGYQPHGLFPIGERLSMHARACWPARQMQLVPRMLGRGHWCRWLHEPLCVRLPAVGPVAYQLTLYIADMSTMHADHKCMINAVPLYSSINRDSVCKVQTL